MYPWDSAIGLRISRGGGDHLAGGSRGGGENVIQDVADVADDFVWEAAAGEHLVEDDTQAVDVGAGVDFVWIALGLLGAAPGEAAHEFAGDAEGLFVRCQGAQRGARESKIKDKGLAPFVYTDIARLEVAVHDS